MSTLGSLLHWKPFQIDALGLVTLLGAEEVNREVGRLSRNKFVDFLPTLGAYVIANNQIVSPIPGFELYNVTDGIKATDLAGWFSRWLTSSDLSFCASTITITSATKKHRRRLSDVLLSYAVGLLTLAPLVVAAVISDWWGVANGIALVASVVVRSILVQQNRAFVDKAVEPGTIEAKAVKVLVTTPDGKIVTIKTTRDIVINILLTTPRPPHPRFYTGARSFGWLAFGAHVISLGMTSLICQLLTVVLLLSATTILAWQVGRDPKHIGSRLLLDCELLDVGFRAATYARLDLSKQEENSMVYWNLFPHRSNKTWWLKYQKAKRENGFATWDQQLAEST
ncbi:hypothetical protein EKO27_g11082 [Xylaria grammica]|uniref:Uncharacterized protein n=1 Tax=Xylaria grammica TaxID=363999 RepID=A0A439CPE2_9PEZI|nr:hypothetical protein EKO27_g11082 [Xylaria grammica]